MTKIQILKKQQTNLINDIKKMLDSFLIGSIASPPSLAGHNLTTKIDGKTKTLYIRKHLVSMAKEMSKRYSLLWNMLQALSKVNLELLKLENE